MARSSLALRPSVPPSPAPTGEFGPPSAGTPGGRGPRRGRGPQSNGWARYEPLARAAFDDGWQSLEDLPPFATSVSVDASRKVITRDESPDISFDRSINP